MRTTRVGLAAAAVAMLIAAIAIGQERQAQSAEGKRLFTQHGCYGCHAVGKTGTVGIGPDLSRIGAQRREADLERWLEDPASQKPRPHMPRIELTPAERKALAAYLATLK